MDDHPAAPTHPVGRPRATLWPAALPPRGPAAPPLPPPDPSRVHVRPKAKARRSYREREWCGPFVRRLSQANLYQLRIWTPTAAMPRPAPPCHGFSVNAGLFPTPRAARQALAAFRELVTGTRPIDVWRAVAELQRRGVIPTGRRGPILPLWVRKAPGGTFVGVYAGGRRPPFRTPLMGSAEAAHMAVWRALCGPGPAVAA